MDIMLQLKQYAHHLMRRIEPWLMEPTPFETTHRICLYYNENTLIILHVDKTSDDIEILLSEDIESDSVDNLKIILADVINRYQLRKIPTYWLLAPDDYQLFFIDALPVKSNEFRDALNWRLRGLLNYPSQDAAIDYFFLPAKKSSANQPMVVAVTARKQQLSKMTDIFSASGIELVEINIPELALLNLTAAFESDEKTTGMLYFYKNMAILNLTRQKTLYFTRRITLPNGYQDQPHFYESMSLELLRYFDYFQSQWRYPSPTRFYVASNNGDITGTIEGLGKHLMIKIEPFPVANLFINQTNTNKIKPDALLPLGAILRMESADVATEY